MTIKEREILIGKLVLFNTRQRGMIKWTVDAMVSNLSENKGGTLTRYCKSSSDNVHDIFRNWQNVTDVWEYITKMAKGQDMGPFAYLDQYYDQQSGFDYQNFECLLFNTYLETKSIEILKILEDKG